MQRREYLPTHDRRGSFESGRLPCRGANIYGLSLNFILLTVIPWILTVSVGPSTFINSDVCHGSAALIVMIILVIFSTVELANRSLYLSLEWMLTIALIGAVTVWSLRIFANTSPIEFAIISSSVFVSMIVLCAVGAKTSLDSIVIYASFTVVWFFVSLAVIVVVMFLMIVKDYRTLAIYLLAVMIYPLFIAFVIFEAMVISNGRVCTNIIRGECVRPARKLYFQFVLIVLLTLLVWRESQNIGIF